MKRINRLGYIAIAASALIASPALADPITLTAGDVGTSFTLDYNGFSDGKIVDGLGGSTTFTLKNVTDTGYSFDYSVANTTGNGVTSRISSFAFDTDPDIRSARSTGTYNFAVLDSKYPNGIGNIDVCFKGGRSNSCAGNSGGVETGLSGSGSLMLGFAEPVNALTLDNFFVRYQSITGAGNITSASGAATSSSSTSSGGGTQVPEPGTLVLFGFGLVGLAFAGRRRGRRNAAPSPRLALA
ncbi:cistern family PEP-CTERM protein [Pseudopontixanthobacter vadosimaris]|uniref:cistern family PEP-CTERM protein n=1 Tax=Pseudopontixanthobacter vadosimaris TaxID=2726450 RepID=UPI001475747A|nr:cistern family PEP-CTERM protein [Pseudopontixanthobacter vadosimaris]